MTITAIQVANALDSCTVPNEGYNIMRNAFPNHAVFLTISGDFVAKALVSGEVSKRFRLVEVED